VGLDKVSASLFGTSRRPLLSTSLAALAGEEKSSSTGQHSTLPPIAFELMKRPFNKIIMGGSEH